MTADVSARIANVRGLYLEGIRDGKPREAMEKYTGARYTQHSTGVADDKDGFIAFFDEFIARNPVREIELLRVFEDGQYVFVQAFQSLNHGEAKWVTADLFDTDENDRIIEHWDVIAEYEAAEPDMLGGPTEPRDLDRTEANRTVLAQFVQEALIGRGKSDLLAEGFVSHGLPSGSCLNELLGGEGAVIYRSLHRLLVQGDFGVSYSAVEKAGEDWAVFDIFRLERDRIAEHWDVQEKIAPREMWNNSGKF